MKPPNRGQVRSPATARADQFRAGLADFTALSDLTGTWDRLEPSAIIDSAASALATMLETDLLYICLWLRTRGEKHEVAYDRKGRLSASATKKLRAARPGVAAPRADTISTPIGSGGSLIWAKSSRRGYPEEMRRLFLANTANQIANAIHSWETAADARLLVSLVDRTRDFVGVADMAGRVEYVNPAGLALVGLESLDSVQPPHMFDFAMEYERKRLREKSMPLVIDHGRWIGEVDLRHFETGDPIACALDWFRIDHPGDGQPMNFAAVLTDLRPQKQAERELRDINDSLEKRVAERTSELEEAIAALVSEFKERRQIAERLDLLQTELLHASRLSVAGQMAAVIAHELSQPLTAVMNSVNTARRLLSSDAPGTDVALREVTEDARNEIERASEIVRRLRFFIRRGSVKRTTEEIAYIIDEGVAFAAVGPSALGVTIFRYFDPIAPVALVDRVQIQQVISNLVRNALEAMKSRRRRELTIATGVHGDNHLEVIVTDNGPGVAEGMKPRLFEPFQTDKSDGMGLGLSICKSIVEAHGGRIAYEPALRGGSTFRFTLEIPATEMAA
jgi:signal transduction histidine kinase